MPRFLIFTAFVGLLILGGCQLVPGSSETRTYLYNVGMSVKDSTSHWAFADPDNPADTLRDSSHFLVTYPADSLLFVYQYDYHPGGGVADGDYYETVLFAVPKGVSDFSIRVTNPAKVYYANSCFGACGVLKVVSAELDGQTAGTGKYHVEGRVIHELGRFGSADNPGYDTTTFSGTFAPAKD